MKFIFTLIVLTLSTLTFAQEINLSEYNWKMTDIAKKGFTKESLFTKMDRKEIKLGSSICSNRALLWAHDFKRFYDIDSAKIFLFYTKMTGEIGRKTWWYHVAPVVNEKGNLWVLDAGFPSKIKGPKVSTEWLHAFSGSTNCKEIKAGENDLIERMFRMATFPERTAYGTYDCYYRIVPGPFWTPASVAKNLLGVNERGQPVRFERDEFDKEELYQACVEATASKIGRALGTSVERCKKLVGRL